MQEEEKPLRKDGLAMADNILTFENTREAGTGERLKPDLPLAKSNPYDPATSPPDILKFLPPDGSMFGLFSDPYARMVYYMPKQGNHTGKYWLINRLEEHSFTENEVKLIDFLAKHRCATRSQIKRAIFSENDRDDKVKDFIKRCRNRGIITSFSWVTPCNDGRKKPIIYGLTRVGAQAAEFLFHIRLPREYQFQPVEYPVNARPKMTGFFQNLVANELYVELKRIDRVVNWERSPYISLPDGTFHRPEYLAEVIKDQGELITFWIEVIRLTDEWYDYTIKRFKETQIALEKLSEEMKPKRILIITDSDSRVPILAQLAEEYMPDGVVRFTTDERLLQGIGKETFLMYDPVNQSLLLSPITFLQEGAPGMKASEYFALHQMNFEDEDEFDE